MRHLQASVCLARACLAPLSGRDQHSALKRTPLPTISWSLLSCRRFILLRQQNVWRQIKKSWMGKKRGGGRWRQPEDAFGERVRGKRQIEFLLAFAAKRSGCSVARHWQTGRQADRHTHRQGKPLIKGPLRSICSSECFFFFFFFFLERCRGMAVICSRGHLGEAASSLRGPGPGHAPHVTSPADQGGRGSYLARRSAARDPAARADYTQRTLEGRFHI